MENIMAHASLAVSKPFATIPDDSSIFDWSELELPMENASRE